MTQHNPSGTSDGWGDPLEQIYLGVGNSKKKKKKKKTLLQQLTIICSMFRLQTVGWERERERKSVRVYEQAKK